MRPKTMTLAIVCAVAMAGLFGPSLQSSSGQNKPFRNYQLRVFCDDSGVATATFWHDVGESMGIKVTCAGNCPGEGWVSLADALAGLPAEVSAALRSEVEKQAAAGKGRSVACVLDDKKPPEGKKWPCREGYLSPKGRSPDKENCCDDKMPEKGTLFTMGTNRPGALIYSEPSTDSRIVGNQPNGMRVVYTQTRRINGQLWYYVHATGPMVGWIRGSELVCLRPGTPIPPVYYENIFFKGTAALTVGARG